MFNYYSNRTCTCIFSKNGLFMRYYYKKSINIYIIGQ